MLTPGNVPDLPQPLVPFFPGQALASRNRGQRVRARRGLRRSLVLDESSAMTCCASDSLLSRFDTRSAPTKTSSTKPFEKFED